MTTLVTGDFHLSSNPRDAYRFVAMEKLAEYIEKYHVDTLIILGDLTEEKDFHASRLVNDVVELLYNLGCMCEVIVLQGNHDYKDADSPFFYFARRLKGIHWIGQPRSWLVTGLGECMFYPHSFNYARDWAFKGKMLDCPYDLIFAHNTFDGAKMSNGKVLKGVPLDIFDQDHTVISGDIHAPQRLGPVLYVGSPYLVDFGDDFQPRVLLFNNNGDAKSIPLDGPQKRLIELRKGYIADDFGYAAKGDVVKVRYSLTSAERDKWPEIKSKLKNELSELGCMVFAVQPMIEQKGAVQRKLAIQQKSDLQFVTEYGKQEHVSDDTLAVGLELIGESDAEKEELY
jgi:hypothetical protein